MLHKFSCFSTLYFLVIFGILSFNFTLAFVCTLTPVRMYGNCALPNRQNLSPALAGPGQTSGINEFKNCPPQKPLNLCCDGNIQYCFVLLFNSVTQLCHEACDAANFY
ncbi:hypothetical protein BY996DRAFT_6427591 [Phakopsora pachyrhizi]|nr:hypothetical protein BY996DRAFT_6427591 [Phakopsora pachyrhizi]